jgi:hypothetical protein
MGRIWRVTTAIKSGFFGAMAGAHFSRQAAVHVLAMSPSSPRTCSVLFRRAWRYDTTSTATHKQTSNIGLSVLQLVFNFSPFTNLVNERDSLLRVIRRI